MEIERHRYIHFFRGRILKILAVYHVAAAGTEKGMIDRKMSVNEVLTRYPGSIKVFEDLGLGCAGCAAALFETIEQAAQVHGADIDRRIAGLVQVIGEK